MSSSNLVRWSGLAATLAGTLIVVSALLGFLAIDFGNLGEEAQTGTFAFYSLGYLLGGVLLLGGLVGLYADQSEDAGLLGLVGFLVAFLGTVLFVSIYWYQAVIVPALAESAPELLEQGELPLGFKVSFWLFSLGWLLFGVATLRAGLYPREASLLLIVGAVFNFVPLPSTEVVLAAAVAWLGFGLFSARGRMRAPRKARRADGRVPEARGPIGAHDDEGPRGGGGRRLGKAASHREEGTRRWQR